MKDTCYEPKPDIRTLPTSRMRELSRVEFDSHFLVQRYLGTASVVGVRVASEVSEYEGSAEAMLSKGWGRARTASVISAEHDNEAV